MISISPNEPDPVAEFPKKQCRYGFKQTITVIYTMGIPSYFKHVIQRYRSIIRKYDKSLRIDNLYLDSNSIIYDAVRSDSVKDAKDIEAAILNEVVSKITFWIRNMRSWNKNRNLDMSRLAKASPGG